MSKDNSIYSKIIPLVIAMTVVVLVGTVITMAMPLLRDDMHPKLESTKEYTAIELEGRNIYQREGCVNCHSQMVRPLTADVVRYGDYTKAGEEFYERPFLWGSKRTGPDLGRNGGKYSDEWQIIHLKNPQKFFPQSNMPSYAFLDRPANAVDAEKSMKSLKYTYTQEDIDQVANSTELEALTAYLQSLGSDIPDNMYVKVEYSDYENTMAPMSIVSPETKVAFVDNCAGCHGTEGEGTDIAAPLSDVIPADIIDGNLFVSIANGIPYTMPSHIGIMTKRRIWELALYAKELANKKRTAIISTTNTDMSSVDSSDKK